MLNKIKSIAVSALAFILSSPNQQESKTKTENRRDDVFFVNDDLSISLNHDSETVKNAFKRNISRLKEIKS